MVNKMVNNSTIVDILLGKATERADQTAYTFLADGDRESGSCTYQELDTQAKAIAVSILTKVQARRFALY